MVGMNELFDLSGRTVVITGGSGLLGKEHARAVGRSGGVPILLDVDATTLEAASKMLQAENIEHRAIRCDVTNQAELESIKSEILSQYGSIWGLINNVASNPPMGPSAKGLDRLENFPISQWDLDISLGLTAALLCARIFGTQMAQDGCGSIINVASDLALISPDQRMYKSGLEPGELEPVKPVSYSVTKAGLLGLTKYLATYWAPTPVRCNALVPGSVEGTQNTQLVTELKSRIPLNRLATPAEYHGAVVFLLSDASAYMTGANLVLDGGRTIW